MDMVEPLWPNKMAARSSIRRRRTVVPLFAFTVVGIKSLEMFVF